MKQAAVYWNNKIESLLPDMPESRREKPLRFDFLDSAEFEEKVDTYSRVRFSLLKKKLQVFQETWKIWNDQPKLADAEAQEVARNGLETKMGDDIEQKVFLIFQIVLNCFQRSENLNREALYDKTWAARCACIVGSCACCIGAKCC